MPLTTAQIGRLGELLVQTKLLEIGIDSAPTTTDAGIDLLALAPIGALAIQVKTNLKPKPGGGAGRLAVDWTVSFSEKCKLDLVAFVRYDTKQVWLMDTKNVRQQAQQNRGQEYHIYWYVQPQLRGANRYYQDQFSDFLFENQILSLIKT